jgi:hypothetical protein
LTAGSRPQWPCVAKDDTQEALARYAESRRSAAAHSGGVALSPSTRGSMACIICTNPSRQSAHAGWSIEVFF